MEYILTLAIGAFVAYLFLRYYSRDKDTDPVCGMYVRPDSPYETEYRGRRYRFCTASCRQKFEANPGKWLQHR